MLKLMDRIDGVAEGIDYWIGTNISRFIETPLDKIGRAALGVVSNYYDLAAAGVAAYAFTHPGSFEGYRGWVMYGGAFGSVVVPAMLSQIRKEKSAESRIPETFFRITRNITVGTAIVSLDDFAPKTKDPYWSIAGVLSILIAGGAELARWSEKGERIKVEEQTKELS